MKRLIFCAALVFHFVPSIKAQDSDTLYFFVYAPQKKQVIVSRSYMVVDIAGPEWNQPIVAALKKDFANKVAQEEKLKAKSVLEITELVSSWDKEEVKARYNELRSSSRTNKTGFKPFSSFKPEVLPGTDMVVQKSR